MLRFTILFGTALTVSTLAFPQEGGSNHNYNVPKIEDLVKIPNSPEAQAFTKYGNTKVNLYTGTPDINIPIHEIQGRELNMPVSLTYDASGIKVEQIATWVGLGWNLKVGGVVTRQALSKPDDYLDANPSYTPFYASPLKADYDLANSLTPNPTPGSPYPAGQLKDYFVFMKKVTGEQAHHYEYQPDTYSFNVNGLSGTLYIDYETNTARCIEHPEIKATPHIINWGSIPIKLITGWTIVSGDGTIYRFENPEKTYVYDENSNDTYREYYSAWHLTIVESKNKRDKYTFTYAPAVQWQQPQIAGRGDFIIDYLVNTEECGSDMLITQPVPLYKITPQELAYITLNNSLILSFVASESSRLDLAGRKSLREIIVYNGFGLQLKKCRFLYSYFGQPTSQNDKLSRLKLDGLEFYGQPGSSPPLVYRFEYIPGEMPSRESRAQDFWGYYNGVESSTLIPHNNDFDASNGGFSGANRSPNFNYCKIGTLNRIIYPTGGYTTFNYGLHQSSEITYSYKQDFNVTQLGLTGGTDPADPFQYRTCEDATAIKPKGIQNLFTINTSAQYKVTVTVIGTPSGGGPHMQFLALYYAGPGPNGVLRTFCDLLNNPPLPPVKHYPNLTSSFTTSLYLESGKYSIMILNTDPNITINVRVDGTQTINKYDVGGLRILYAEDYDISGSPIVTKYYYYGDLSLIAPNLITKGFITNNNNVSSAILHSTVNFEEPKQIEMYHYGSVNPSLINCNPVYRYSSNRTQSQLHVTYAAVSEIEFTGNGPEKYNGYTVYNFHNEIANYVVGFSRGTPLNGKLLEKRNYNDQGQLLQIEKNFFTQTSIGSTSSFTFHSTQQNVKDIYVLAPTSNPAFEHFIFEYAIPAGPNFSETHCSRTFTGLTKIYCLGETAKYNKIQFSLPRYWIKHDSSLFLQYDGTNFVHVSSKFYYENTDHYQPTRIDKKDSKGILRTTNLSYPHELQINELSNPAWSNLITNNRITEPIEIRATYASNQPDFVQKTEYKGIPVGNNTVYVPDVIKLSSGTGPLEPRIRIHQYDNAGNITEISKESDMRTSYIWGYNQTFPIAVVQNALVSEIFHTSFEAGEEGGNSADNDSRTGIKSKTGGYSKLLTGLTPNKSYQLTYWQKNSGAWGLFSLIIDLNSTTTTYTINLTGQVDEIRFHPVGALMTTYTYTPGLGITSVTDPNNQTTYYEYDAMGRLWLIRDSNKKIIKEHKYNYRNNQ